MTGEPFGLAERAASLRRAAGEPFELVVVGGGITGAGVLRDAAMRGVAALLVERGDFASGTSSATSKMIHGGLRYLARGDLAVTRESSVERDLLAAANPNLVRPLPFLLPSFEGGTPLWRLRAALAIYHALGGRSGHRRHEAVSAEEAVRICPALEGAPLRGALLYWDAEVDDARIVLETIKSARRNGGEAVSYAEAVGFLRDGRGRVAGVRVRDRLSGREVAVRAAVVVNAAGPSAERVRALGGGATPFSMRPAKGAHLVVSRERLPAAAAVAFRAPDGRHMFVSPFWDAVLVGTTDTFTDEVDEPAVTAEDRDYLLGAANAALPAAGLTADDVLSVFAGVRPLVASAGEERPPSAVSREHSIDEDETGLITVAGGKLTTYRRMAERIVDRVVRRLPAARRGAVGGCRTAAEPLREDRFERAELERELARRFGVSPASAEHLVEAWGEEAERMLEEAPEAWREPVGASRYLYAECAWAWRHDCPATLADVLERRVRVAVFAPGQGLAELDRLAAVVGEAAGWDAARREEEARAYREVVGRRYRVRGEETRRG